MALDTIQGIIEDMARQDAKDGPPTNTEEMVRRDSRDRTMERVADAFGMAPFIVEEIREEAIKETTTS